MYYLNYDFKDTDLHNFMRLFAVMLVSCYYSFSNSHQKKYIGDKLSYCKTFNTVVHYLKDRSCGFKHLES